MTIQINGTSGISGVDGSAATPALQGSDTNTGISFGTDEVNINTGGTTRATVDSSGRVLVGTSSAAVGFGNIQNFTTTFFSSLDANYSNDANPVIKTLGKSRGALGTYTTVQSGDALGRIQFAGADGIGLIRAAQIQAEVDGTPGANDMPGRLVFSTTADGASSPTERVRITKEGYLRVHTIPAMYGDNFDWVNTNAKMHAGFIFYDTTNSWNNTTGVYTCPVDGKYLVCADVQGHNTSIQPGANGTYYNIFPFKNGSAYGTESVATSKDGTGSTGKHDVIAFSVVIAANANDTIEVRSNHGYRSNTQNHLTIVYLG